MNPTIIVTYSSIDRCRVTRRYRTLDGARAFAQEYVGRSPSIGSSYAVSDDGVGKITVRGADLADLFPAHDDGEYTVRDLDADYEAGVFAQLDREEQGRQRYDVARREAGCSCSEQQLNLVGCFCQI